MPNDTFERLKPEKKERVIEAIINEYTRVPLEQVSIKNIVIEAGIPRGSFYQYFDDKEDVLRYLIRSQQEMRIIGMKEPENLFMFIRHICRRELMTLETDALSVRMRLLRQISCSPRASAIFNEVIHQSIIGHQLFLQLWETEGLSGLSEDERIAILDLISTALKEVLLDAMTHEKGIDEAMGRLDTRLNIIQEGVRVIYQS